MADAVRLRREAPCEVGWRRMSEHDEKKCGWGCGLNPRAAGCGDYGNTGPIPFLRTLQGDRPQGGAAERQAPLQPRSKRTRVGGRIPQFPAAASCGALFLSCD